MDTIQNLLDSAGLTLPSAIAAFALQIAVLCIGYVHQLHLVIRDKMTEGLSAPKWALVIACHAAWLWYAVEIGSFILVACNAIGLVLSALIVTNLRRNVLSAKKLEESPDVIKLPTAKERAAKDRRAS